MNPCYSVKILKTQPIAFDWSPALFISLKYSWKILDSVPFYAIVSTCHSHLSLYLFLFRPLASTLLPFSYCDSCSTVLCLLSMNVYYTHQTENQLLFNKDTCFPLLLFSNYKARQCQNDFRQMLCWHKYS